MRRSKSLRAFVPTTALVVFSLCAGALQETASLEEALKLMNEQKWAEAAGVLERVVAEDADNERAWNTLGFAYYYAGEIEKAHETYIKVAEYERYRASALYNHACIHAVRKEVDEAFRLLNESYEAGLANVDLLRTDPELDALRSDPRFGELLLKISKRAAEPRPLNYSTWPLEAVPAAHQFDFTLGDWDLVSAETNEVVQRQDIQVIFDGAGIQRDIYDLKGKLRAKSWFVYAEGPQEWKQIWLDSEGRTSTMLGSFQDGAMVLRQVTRDEVPDDSVRLTYRPLADQAGFESVYEETDDAGESWRVVATTRYVKRKPAAEEQDEGGEGNEPEGEGDEPQDEGSEPQDEES